MSCKVATLLPRPFLDRPPRRSYYIIHKCHKKVSKCTHLSRSHFLTSTTDSKSAGFKSRLRLRRRIKNDLNNTYKKLTVVPEESLTEVVRESTLQYIMQMSELDPSRVHFLDESSVKRTTGNRKYGHAFKGKPAMEVKRYASNCNYTVNLLQSIFGITIFGILNSASNGPEMLAFFNESLNIANGDTVIMDNCGSFTTDDLPRLN